MHAEFRRRGGGRGGIGFFPSPQETAVLRWGGRVVVGVVVVVGEDGNSRGERLRKRSFCLFLSAQPGSCSCSLQPREDLVKKLRRRWNHLFFVALAVALILDECHPGRDRAGVLAIALSRLIRDHRTPFSPGMALLCRFSAETKTWKTSCLTAPLTLFWLACSRGFILRRSTRVSKGSGSLSLVTRDRADNHPTEIPPQQDAPQTFRIETSHVSPQCLIHRLG